MTTLTCPKCRQGMPDEALDVGQCPACGFPLDGPVVLGPQNGGAGVKRLLIAVGVLVLLAGAGFGSYTLFTEANNNTETELAKRDPVVNTLDPEPPVVHRAPWPHEPKRLDPGAPQNTNPMPGTGDKGQPPEVPVIAVPPKKDGPRPIGVKMAVNPKIEPNRHFDNPDDIAAVPDLNSNDRVVLTGRVRTLTLGAVNGKGTVDASGLVAEEVIIGGDMTSEANVTVNAPSGKVTLKGWIAGNSHVTVQAAGGTVVLGDSGRCTGGSTITITAKRVESTGMMNGGTKVNVTFTAGGFMKIAKAEEGATITYKRIGAGEPVPVIERGDFRGGAKLVEAK